MQISTPHTARQVAAHLLDCGAVKVNPGTPYTWASGWKSPIYTDNRLTLSFPEIRSFIKTELAALINAQFPEAEGIAGVATGGIPQGALVADVLHLPFLYVRPEPKGHGLRNQVEGRLLSGQKLVVVEDLISTGKSSLAAVSALRAAGADVLGMVCVFTYGFALADKAFQEAGLPCFPLSDYLTLISMAREKELVSAGAIPLLEAWRKAPEVWGN